STNKVPVSLVCSVPLLNATWDT
ncbi:unnamed protein product, partial [Rotaria sordida]